MSNPQDTPAVDLRAELEKRRTWFYECQLRGLNTQSFRGVVARDAQKTAGDPFPDERINLISEPLFTWGFPAGQIGGGLKNLGPVYLDSQEPVWTDDERTRRDAFAQTFIGLNDNWFGYRAGTRLGSALADLKAKYELSQFASLAGPAADLAPDLVTFARFGPESDFAGLGRAVSRAKLAEAKPWLIPELYNNKNKDARKIGPWIENLEQFIADFEAELTIAAGGIAGQPIPFDATQGDAYRTWIRFLLDVMPTRDAADALKSRMLTLVTSADGKSSTYQKGIQVETNGYPMGPVEKFPFSSALAYWTNVVKDPLEEAYVSKANADMGLCSLMRVIYLFGTLPAGLGSDADLTWRKRQAPGTAFDTFFSQKAADETLKTDEALRGRLQAAQAKLRVILEESASRPRCAPPTFSPLAGEVVRQAVHAFKFWLDEPFRPSDNAQLQKARQDAGIATGDEITSDLEYWSENHYIMLASSEYLAGQLWENDQFQPAREFLSDPKVGILSGKNRKERGKARVLRWLNNRLMFGWTEFNSSGYYREHLWSILNLADFALDAEVRVKAQLAVDLLLFDVARFLHKGTMGAAGGRSQFKSKSSGWDNALCDVVEILWSPRGVFSDNGSEIGISIATSTYQVPDVLLEIGSRPPANRFTDRSRVSINFDEAPKYGISYSQKTDQRDSLMIGYLPKRQQFFPFMDAVNQEIARTHNGFGQAENDTVFWWGTSSYFNKQVVRGTFDAVKKFGLDKTGIFGSSLPTLIKAVAGYEKAKHGLIGGLIGSLAGPVGAVVGGAIGFFEDDIFGNDLEEAAGDDLSVLLEGSTRTRANILTFRTPDVMLSSLQNFRAGQFNFQSSVHQATLHPALNVFTTSGFVDIDISDLTAAVGGGLLGAALGIGLSVVTGGLGGVLVAGLATAGAATGIIGNEVGLKHSDKPLLADNDDGPGWWTGYWSLPMIVQHDAAAIIAYDFHEIQSLLSQTHSHVWFPKSGFDRVDEQRTSAYDDADFPLLDIGHIGPKGFWLFGKVVHPPDGAVVPGEAYIGVFSNGRPAWQDQGSDFYKKQLDITARKPFRDGMDNLKSLLDDIEDGDSGSAGRDAVKAAVDQAIVSTYQDGIKRDDWVKAATDILSGSADPQVQANLAKAKQIAGVEIDLEIQRRIWPDPLPQDYFADRDWLADGKNVWIIQVGSRQEFGDFETFKDRVSRARVHISDDGDQECTYDIPMPDGSSERLTLDYSNGGQFQLNGSPFLTDLYPRFENPFLRGGRVEWGQREYVIEYNGKSLLHEFSDFSQPSRQEAVTSTSDDRNTIKALVIFIRTGDENMDTFTVATADVTLGCVQGTRDQVVAAGPVDENTDHDAEWIFLDAPSLRAPDMTITLKHPAGSTAGNDTPHWKMSFTLRALMGDRIVRDCSLSFSYSEFVDDNRRSPEFPFSIPLFEWRPWEIASADKFLDWWTIAKRRPFAVAYYDVTDLVARDDTGSLWHRRMRSCRAAEEGWFALPVGGSNGPNLNGPILGSAVSSQPGNLTFFLQSEGKLFVTSVTAHGPQNTAWQPLEVFIYPDGLFGIPDTSAPAIPIALSGSSPVLAVPSTISIDGVEIHVLGGDGHVYSHPDWRPGDVNPWRKIDVTGFSPLFGHEFLVAGDVLLVLGSDGALWGTAIDHSSRHSVPAWDKISSPGVAIVQVTATFENGISQVVSVRDDGRIIATTYRPGSPSTWAELDLPGTTAASGVPPSSAMPSVGSSWFFALGADGHVYSISCDSTAGWSANQTWEAVEPDSQDFTPRVGGNLVASSRVNGQVEVFVEDVKMNLSRAWWS
jgi:hypothetical protein